MKKTLLTLAFAGIAMSGFAADYATGTLEAPLTVEEFIAGGCPASNDTPAAISGTYVKGYIVGFVNGTYWTTKDGASNIVFGVPTEEYITGSTTSKTTTNIVLAGTSGETDFNYCIPVALPATAVRDELNLYANPQNLGHEVILCGDRQRYMTTTGLKNIVSYQWVGEAPTPGQGGGDEPGTPSAYIYEGLTSTDAECTWTFVDNSFQKADGTEGTVWSWKTYNGASYLNGSSYAGSAAAATAYAVSPEIDLTAATDVTVVFEHAAKFQTNLTADDKFVVREVGGEWQVVDIPTYPTAGSWTFVESGSISLKAFEGKKVQLGFKYVGTDTSADTWEIRNLKVSGNNGAGVAGVEADGVATYFNLNGVKVANPANGMYIKVLNGKATKVVVK